MSIFTGNFHSHDKTQNSTCGKSHKVRTMRELTVLWLLLWNWIEQFAVEVLLAEVFMTKEGFWCCNFRDIVVKYKHIKILEVKLCNYLNILNQQIMD